MGTLIACLRKWHAPVKLKLTVLYAAPFTLLVVLRALKSHRWRNGLSLYHTIGNTTGKRRLYNDRVLKLKDANYLQSVRVEMSGQNTDENLFAAIQVILPLEKSHVLESERLMQRILPPGKYSVEYFITGTCFTRDWLEADGVLMPQEEESKACHPGTSLKTKNFNKKVVEMFSNCTNHGTLVKLEPSEVGYWHNSIWYPSRCQKTKTMSIKLTFDRIYIHIAGDSVARDMLGNFCRQINATMFHTILGIDKKAKFRHCCTRALHKCIIFRMSWFPRDNFSPEYMRTNLRTREQYCSESRSISECISSVAQEAFDFDSPQLWHWLFYGSHSPKLGASNVTCQQMRRLLPEADRTRTVLFGTPAIREDLIPGKYADQRRIRTNARIATLNEFLSHCVYPQTFIDLFPASYSRHEHDFVDAIHMNANASTSLSNMIWSTLVD